MNRRTIIKRVGSAGVFGLAGCASPPVASSENSSTPSKDIQRRVSITDQESIPEKFQLQIEASMLESTITESHTAKIKLTITNHGPPRGISVSSTGGCALFHKSSLSSKPRGIWLSPVGETTYVSETDWIADPPEGGSYPDYGCGLWEFDSGESVQNEYKLYHDGRTSGYLNPGTYRFEETIFATPGESHEEWDRDAEAAFTVPWGVSVSLKNPNCTLIC